MKISIFVAVFLTCLTTVFGALHRKMQAKGKSYYGSIADPNTLRNGNVQTILKSEFGMITPENSMKWESTEPSRGNFDFSSADKTVNFAIANNLRIRGHTLVYHSQLPPWVSSITSRVTLKSVLESHIHHLATRWKGKLYAWDVVNEPLNENGSFRPSVFYRVLGEQYIDIAFHAARAADPYAKLYINDYNLDGPGKKLDAMIALIGRLKSRGVPIDGVGSQAHLILGKVRGSAVKTALQRLGDTGLNVAITELDIRIPKPVTAAKLAQQLIDYNSVTMVCLKVAKCVGISVWGVSDKDSWVDTTFPSYDAPLLWDDSFNRKAAYKGVDKALS